MSSKLITLASCAALAGCSLMPDYQRPEAALATNWPASASLDPAAARPAATTPPWQDFFTDSTLRQLIETALSHNHDLRLALLNIEQAQAQLGIRRADQLPTVNAGLSGSRTPDSKGGIASNYTAGLLVTAYELDFFGRVASLKEQALAQYLATAEASQTARISLVATVAQAWLSLLANEELLALSRQTLASREASLQLTELKFKHGAASELEVRLAQTLRDSARVSLAQYQRQRALDENALRLLLGQPVTPAQSSAAPTLSQLSFAELPAGLPSELLTRRPDIRQAEQLLIASNANIGAARAAFFPRISLTAGVGSASNELAGLFKDGSWGWTLSPQLLLPIFDGGRNQANLELSQTGRKMALVQYEKTIQSAFREVSDALASRANLSQQLQAQQDLLQAEQARQQLTQLRLTHGAASQLESLEAQRALFAAQQALVQTRLATLQNQIALYKALGGGAATPSLPSGG